jgi:hypothetical protein
LQDPLKFTQVGIFGLKNTPSGNPGADCLCCAKLSHRMLSSPHPTHIMLISNFTNLLRQLDKFGCFRLGWSRLDKVNLGNLAIFNPNIWAENQIAPESDCFRTWPQNLRSSDFKIDLRTGLRIAF